jgi:hypothetical protein
MIERGEELGLPVKTGQPVGVVGDRGGQDLDRDATLQPGVDGGIHLAHATGADGGEDLVGTEARTGCERHVANSTRQRRLAGSGSFPADVGDRGGE